ncbi:TonB-dependent hemoglobin/transferrin/lactoferrin family receptor [Yersinia rohdei]|uniref:TonB-dependent hemoglobin/transferrin/lactoferrin family receptor n=1 Tax=Yersinia rohdei TaxID=29485 RepID=UPI0011A0F7DC|nr:TonB-dependent hemoglobin/transferrin/lactoferrin family receptor [Yersinia rohdei]
MNNMIRDKRTRMKSINKVTLGLFIALSSQGYSERVNAESAKENDMLLDELKVEGTSDSHEGDWVYDELHSVSEISREQLDNRPARHVADILEQTPGVYSSLNQQDPALSINIRGVQDYGRINMNIDGMRQNFMKSGHGQRNGVMYIDPEILSSVVIEKGATSGMGSAGVIGGIATFNTINASDFLAPGKEIGGKIRAITGDNGTHFIGSTALAIGNEYGDLLIAASERNLKDYWPGDKGSLGEVRIGAKPGANKENKFSTDIKNNKILFTNYKMRSRLAKIGWNLPAHQRLSLSYLQTQIHSPNAGMFTILYDKAIPGVFTYGWLSSSVSDVMNRNIGLDYSLKPEHISWLDLTAKIYYVDTQDETDVHNANTVFRKKYWTKTRLTTQGFQLQNTSLFTPADHHQVRIQYGLEWFSDRSRGRTTNDYISELSPTNKGTNGLTPPGTRTITSTFAQFNYDYNDWLRLEGGLRFDQFHIQGDTWMYTRGYRAPYTRESPCDPRRHEQSERKRTQCTSSALSLMTWNVDHREQQFSPTAAIGIKPGVPWLEFFGNYGKSWRPPAMTEMLVTGSAHGHGWMMPNPLAAAERSKTWEVGTNIQHKGLFINDDRFAAKLAYFDTRVSNYINLALSMKKPKLGDSSFANATYINNLLQTQFRGLEYQLSYDAGVFYASLNYTKMIGENNFCIKRAWLGGVQQSVWIKQGYPYGLYPSYPVNDDRQNNTIKCYTANMLFGSSAYLPGDRGSLTLGGRIFDQKLDFGTIIRYNKGHQDKSVLNSYGFPNTAYVADWPKYTIFDLYASYQVTNNLILRASIENMNNRAYLISYGDTLSFAPNRGRTIQGGFEYKF